MYQLQKRYSLRDYYARVVPKSLRVIIFPQQLGRTMIYSKGNVCGLTFRSKELMQVINASSVRGQIADLAVKSTTGKTQTRHNEKNSWLKQHSHFTSFIKCYRCTSESPGCSCSSGYIGRLSSTTESSTRMYGMLVSVQDSFIQRRFWKC